MAIESPVSAQLKAEIKTEIPASASGRLVDAITDIIRPFSEKRGLKADLIRMQRDEVAFIVLQRAHQRVEEMNAPIKPIPNKGLVQLLEHASLEEADDGTMVSMWASLLANAAIQGDPSLPRFVRILSEMNGAQARLLDRMIWHDEQPDAAQLDQRLRAIDDAVTSAYANEIASDFKEELGGRSLVDRLHKLMLRPGIAYHGFHTSGATIRSSEAVGGLPCSPDDELDYVILESLGLVKSEEIATQYGASTWGGSRPFVYGTWKRVTSLGVALYSRCNPLPASPP